MGTLDFLTVAEIPKTIKIIKNNNTIIDSLA